MLIFTHVEVKEEIVVRLRQALKEHGFERIKVIKADPREVADIPCIAISRAGDDETSQVIGEDFGMIKEEDQWIKYTGTYFNETLEIRVWHNNADERDKLYILTKAILFDMRKELTELGLLNITLRGGRDEQDNTFPPYPLYWAPVNMNFLNPLEVTKEVYSELVQIDGVLSVLKEGVSNG